MIDESFDTEQMKQPAQPWEFRSKPAWQRLLIMAGGVLFNFILALFIYGMVLFTWGQSYIPLKDMKMGMVFNETARQRGFADGDILLSADGKELKRTSITETMQAREKLSLSFSLDIFDKYIISITDIYGNTASFPVENK